MINENFIIDSFGDESTSDYLKSVPVGYLRSKGFDESLIGISLEVVEHS
jgi:hypothetical protein